MSKKRFSGKNFVRTGTSSERSAVALEMVAISPACASVVEVGGLIVDHGWVRVFGDGREDPRLEEWNSESRIEVDDSGPAFFIANDVIGGIFLMSRRGSVLYLSPDSLEVEEATEDYASFVEFALEGDLDTFYEGYRFPGWKDAVGRLSTSDSYFSYPPLWAEGGETAFQRERSVVPALELRTFILKAISLADS